MRYAPGKPCAQRILAESGLRSRSWGRIISRIYSKRRMAAVCCLAGRFLTPV